MSKKKRIRIVSNGRAGIEGDTQVFVDGVDVTSTVRHVTWSIGSGFPENMSVATVTFNGVELDVEYVAEQREESVTVVPGAYFDELVAELDAPDEPNERVRAAARRLRDAARRAGNPAESIPERERLVHDNPALAQQIREGVEEAEAGRTVSLGSFAQYLDDEGEEPGA